MPSIIPRSNGEKIIASYPTHEREARTKGIPILGTGRIFPVAEESITCEPRIFPEHSPRLGALDFGWDHPFAASRCLDRDEDMSMSPRPQAATSDADRPCRRYSRMGEWLPFAWPHDGRRDTKARAWHWLSNTQRKASTCSHPRATFDDGSVSVEAGLMEMLDRMQTGRLKVFASHRLVRRVSAVSPQGRQGRQGVR